jgi:hypothetical protein
LLIYGERGFRPTDHSLRVTKQVPDSPEYIFGLYPNVLIVSVLLQIFVLLPSQTIGPFTLTSKYLPPNIYLGRASYWKLNSSLLNNDTVTFEVKNLLSHFWERACEEKSKHSKLNLSVQIP